MKDIKISERIKNLRKAQNLTQEQLVSEMQNKVDRVSISNWERGVNTPSYENILELAKVLKSSYEYIKNGKQQVFEKLSVDKVKIPVISWQQAVNHKETLKNFVMDDKTVFLTVSEDQSKDCFGLKVRDDSMYSGHYRSFPPDCYIAINPDREPKANDNVVAIIEGLDEVVFKQYVKDGVNHYLRPLNPQYEKILVDEKVKIIGVVVKQEIHY